jgi:hypothetical protein
MRALTPPEESLLRSLATGPLRMDADRADPASIAEVTDVVHTVWTLYVAGLVTRPATVRIGEEAQREYASVEVELTDAGRAYLAQHP